MLNPLINISRILYFVNIGCKNVKISEMPILCAFPGISQKKNRRRAILFFKIPFVFLNKYKQIKSSCSGARTRKQRPLYIFVLPEKQRACPSFGKELK